MENSQHLYRSEQLPESLKPLCNSRGYVSADEVDKTLSEVGISLYAIEQMKDSKAGIEAIQGYKLGITKCFPSLSAICNNFLLGVDEFSNAFYIESMHSAAKPFYQNILKASSSDIGMQARELLEAKEFACSYFNNLIDCTPYVKLTATDSAVTIKHHP
ncbi:hypothetical protein VCHA53O466_50518 [Vibrio chagasii]|nr:hypothetical protein VCHA53O466_50518 [Vibrio chagasii]